MAWYTAVGVWFFRVLWSRHFTFTIQLVVSLTLLVALSLTIPNVAMGILSIAIVFDLMVHNDCAKPTFRPARLLQIPAGVAMLGVLSYFVIYTYLV